MEYTDNPRKIYGRVEIIYSDAEISKDIVATVSANSTISHPDEVHESHLTPTVKACTMDGNSTMDGSFQMMAHLLGRAGRPLLSFRRAEV